jgi:hypothetical protein
LGENLVDFERGSGRRLSPELLAAQVFYLSRSLAAGGRSSFWTESAPTRSRRSVERKCAQLLRNGVAVKRWLGS